MWQTAQEIDLAQIEQIPDHKFVHLAKQKIAYRDIGSGPVVVCIPPWGQPGTSFVPFSLAVAQSLRVISLDFPGWGGRSTGPIAHTMAQLAAIVAEFIAVLGIKDYSLLGYSLGGGIALQGIKTHKLNPTKLALISAVYAPQQIKELHPVLINAYALYRKLHLRGLGKLVLRRMFITELKKYGYWNMYHRLPLMQALIAEDKRLNVYALGDAILDAATQNMPADFGFSGEKLVLFAENDPEFIKNQARQIAQVLNVEPLLLDQTDHNHLTFAAQKSTSILLNFFLA